MHLSRSCALDIDVYLFCSRNLPSHHDMHVEQAGMFRAVLLVL